MIFAIYLPPAAEEQDVPLLWWLSGLTCTDENFMQKAGAHGTAAELGLAIVCPDTSPRGTDLPGEHDSYDFGSGAGFYVNATEAPWNRHYRMYDYVTEELPALVARHFPLNGQQSISGHSMGGHGALVCALKHPERYASVSAFAPIANPTQCPWGEKALGGHRRPGTGGNQGGPGRGGQLLPGRAAAPGSPGSGLQAGRRAADPAYAAGVRPLLLLYRQLYRRPPALSRASSA